MHSKESQRGGKKPENSAQTACDESYICMFMYIGTHTLRMAYDARACVFIFTYTNTHTRTRAHTHAHTHTEPQAEDSAQMARDVAAAMLRKIDSRSSVAEAAEIGRQIVKSQEFSSTNYY
jgi:hypothetical protein